MTPETLIAWDKALSCAARLINRRHRDASFDDSIEGNKEHNVNEANIIAEILELQSFERKYDVENLIEAKDDFWIEFYLQKHQDNI